jgi:outer membrane receptor protein involved in Fe transport
MAPRRAEPSADVRTLPSSASVLTTADVQNAQYREPGEVVRALPGVGFVYYGQGGIPSGPTVRGYTDRNFGQDIAGFLDGIPLNLQGFVASHGALDLTVLVPEALERVELVRGPIDARYGEFNRGGTLNFVTRDGVARSSVVVGGGTYGSWNLAGDYGNFRSPGRGSVYSHADGGGSQGSADNQDQWRSHLFNRAVIPLRRGDLSFTAQNGWSRWNAPGYLAKTDVVAGLAKESDAANPTDGGRLQHNLYAVRYRVGASAARPFEATLFLANRSWTRWRHDVLLGPAQPQVRQTDSRVTWGYRVEQTWGHFVGARPLLFTAGTTRERIDAETKQARTLRREFVAWNDDIDELITDTGAYVQGQFGVTNWLKALGGLRFTHVHFDIDDNLRQPGQFVPEYSASQWQPKVGLVIAPSRHVEFYTNYATGMRSPTPRTEVRNSIGSIDRVKIARTESYEVGATVRPWRRVDVDATWWQADNSNEVRGIPPGGVQFESLGKSRRDGASLDVRWFLLSTTRVSAGISWVKARLLEPLTTGATHLPDIPGYVHQVGIQTPLGSPATMAGRFAAAFDLYFYGRKDLDTRGAFRSDAYQRGTFRVTYAHSARYRAWLGGFFYPESTLGESEYLFGSRVGVRPNPRADVSAGLGVTF